MDPREAILLIKDGLTSTAQPQIWLDLGCGKGTFTYALASILPAGSTIIAMDRETQQLNTHSNPEVTIEFKKVDFEKEELEVGKVSGILMANSLHFVKDKIKLINRLASLFSSSVHFIIIEYDTMAHNPWVPYPIDFVNIKNLFSISAETVIKKIGEYPSVYNDNNIYAASITLKIRDL